MTDLIDRLLHDVARAVANINTARGLDLLGRSLHGLEELIPILSEVMSRERACVVDSLMDSSGNAANLGGSIDIERVLADVDAAQLLRASRMEHEMMAKLVSKLRDKQRILAEVESAKQSIEFVQQSRVQAENDYAARKLAVSMLDAFLTDMSRTLRQDIPEEKALIAENAS